MLDPTCSVSSHRTGSDGHHCHLVEQSSEDVNDRETHTHTLAAADTWLPPTYRMHEGWREGGRERGRGASGCVVITNSTTPKYCHQCRVVTLNTHARTHSMKEHCFQCVCCCTQWAPSTLHWVQKNTVWNIPIRHDSLSHMGAGLVRVQVREDYSATHHSVGSHTESVESALSAQAAGEHTGWFEGITKAERNARARRPARSVRAAVCRRMWLRASCSLLWLCVLLSPHRSVLQDGRRAAEGSRRGERKALPLPHRFGQSQRCSAGSRRCSLSPYRLCCLHRLSDNSKPSQQPPAHVLVVLLY